MNPTISVSEDLNREPGYTVYTVSGVEGNIERLSYSVIRHGYDYNYLGESEWQAAFAWLEPEDAWYESGQLKFVVPPEVTWQMDPQGYVLKLDLYPSIGELSIDFFWPDVLPGEPATTPSVEHRLAGTRVKPATKAPPTEPDKSVTPEPEPLAEPAPKPEPAQPPPESQAVLEPAPVIAQNSKKGLGMGTVVSIVIVLLVALATVYWFMLRPDDKTAMEQTVQPSAPTSNGAAERAKQESTPEPVVEPETIVQPPTPVVTEAQVIQEKRGSNTRMAEPAVVQAKNTPVQDSSSTPGASDTDTRGTLTEILGTRTTEQPSRTKDDIFNSIEPALREEVGE